MKNFLLGAALSAALILPAHAALKTGDAAPDFSAKASLAGKEFKFSLKQALKKGPVVVYFYPAAFTGGCNIEAHTFAEDKTLFDAAHTTIIGVSRDKIARLNEFSADPAYCAGKFPVASDEDGAIAKAFALNSINIPAGHNDSRGQPIPLTQATERTTFVIGKDSKVLATFSTNDQAVKPDEHAENSLAFVQNLKK